MIEKLSKGYERFRNGYFLDNRERLERLAVTPVFYLISNPVSYLLFAMSQI